MLFLYAPVRDFGFVWDDVAEVQRNPLLHGALGPGLLASNHEHMGVRRADWLLPSHESLRPLRYLSYRLDAVLHGLNPGAMHLHNLLLAWVGLLVAYFVARRWGLGGAAAALAALIFGLHPLQVEPTAYISARSDLLGGVLGLLSVGLGLSALQRLQHFYFWLAASALAFLLALSAKEATVLLPFTVVVQGFVLLRRDDALKWDRLTWVGATYALTAAVWFGLRSSYVRSSGSLSPIERAHGFGTGLLLGWEGRIAEGSGHRERVALFSQRRQGFAGFIEEGEIFPGGSESRRSGPFGRPPENAATAVIGNGAHDLQDRRQEGLLARGYGGIAGLQMFGKAHDVGRVVEPAEGPEAGRFHHHEVFSAAGGQVESFVQAVVPVGRGVPQSQADRVDPLAAQDGQQITRGTLVQEDSAAGLPGRE